MSYMQKQEGKNTDRYYVVNKEKTDKEYYVCRSTWEQKFFKWLDHNKNILKWSSEPLAVPYFDPVTNKDRRYYPDVLAKVKTKDNKEKVYLIEIKPYKETVLPKKTKNKTNKTMLYEQKTWLTNTHKWKSAIRFCKKRGWEFKIITEKDLFGN